MTEHIQVTCNQCGKLIVETNKYGMFCEDRCGYEESVKRGKELDTLLGECFENNVGETSESLLEINKKD